MSRYSPPFDYSRALRPDEVLVCLFDRQNYYPTMSAEMAEAAAEFGFTFATVDPETSLPPVKDFLLRHAIIVDGVDDPSDITQRYQSVIEQFDTATMAVSYSGRTSFNAAAGIVASLKSEYPHINYLLPSRLGDGFRPSKLKLIDNSICDSVRVKYVPRRSLDRPSCDLPPDIEAYFTGVSELVRQHKLYHRSETDGFISIRNPSGGFFITSTKTDKCTLSLDRVVLVHAYDRSNNLIDYSGAYLPSSDCVEAATVYARQPWVQSIVHTHASELFTRNPRYRDKVAVPPSTYGQADLGDDIVDFLEQTATRDFIILDDHGEFIFSDSASAAGCLAAVESFLEQEILVGGN